jgi:hypothetical protein
LGEPRGSHGFILRSAPNPFGPTGSTEITLSLPSTCPIEVGIYDTRGRKVRTLYSGEVPGRILRLHWDGCGEDGNPVAQSIYFCKVRMGDMALTRKLTRIQ